MSGGVSRTGLWERSHELMASPYGSAPTAVKAFSTPNFQKFHSGLSDSPNPPVSGVWGAGNGSAPYDCLTAAATRREP
jgi:hypothetical protein